MGVILLRYAVKQKENSYAFQRLLIDMKHIKMIREDLQYQGYYFAGVSGDSIYLGNYTASRHLLAIPKDLRGKRKMSVDTGDISLSLKGHYHQQVQDGSFYMFNGLARVIHTSTIQECKLQNFNAQIPFFQQGIPISKGSVILSYVANSNNCNSLRKCGTGAEPISNEQIFKKQVDGIFCTSGMLHYSPTLQRLCYVYFYRNDILLIDTNLQLKSSFKTIDPFDSVSFEVSTIKSNHKSVITSDHNLVNARTSEADGKLYVQSKIMGRNEDANRFKHSLVIDVYDLKALFYNCSFYIPLEPNHPVSDFKVVGHYLYTIAGTTIKRYTLQLPKTANR